MTRRMLVRPPAVAGRFYPADPVRLAAAVDDYVAAATTAGALPKALVVPHAGYVYSGPVAGSGYRLLRGAADRVTRVVLLGPAHYVAVRGLAVSSAEGFETPLGVVPVDAAARDEALARSSWVEVDDRVHAPEHSLEVHLPFLQRVLGGVPVLPLVVGGAPDAATAEVLELWWDDPATVVIVSSDLSHYESYEVARSRDERTAAAVVALDADHLSDHDACGAYPLRGLLRIAAARGATAQLLDLRSSGDTAGPRDRVVGYGAFAVGAGRAA
ncbi:MAG: AmmeMemoRadiSam system protein B [Actinomycetia bacterium]|nr:AmmeMemoRadiSam system protein B [Actinomycetes bacterium]